jgi:hypothetical protein
MLRLLVVMRCAPWPLVAARRPPALPARGCCVLVCWVPSPRACSPSRGRTAPLSKSGSGGLRGPFTLPSSYSELKSVVADGTKMRRHSESHGRQSCRAHVDSAIPPPVVLTFFLIVRACGEMTIFPLKLDFCTKSPLSAFCASGHKCRT